MTSKEALNKIHSALDTSNVCDTEQLRTEFDTIRKDLEVLEILKRNIYSSDESVSVILDDLRNFGDFKKVKEWLDND